MIRTLTVAGTFALMMAAQPSTAPPAQPPPSPAPQAASRELVRPSDLVTVQHGTLPIIISAPHGGQCRVPGSKDRTTGVTVRDDMTAEVAMLVAQRITARLGQKPSFVIAQFSRKDADANRAPGGAEAYENVAAKAQYDAYHEALRTLVDEAAARKPGAILIDFHGQKREPDAIVRGTRDGKTVARLLARAGEAALTGPDSICGKLRHEGYTILPTLDEPTGNQRHPMNETLFDGGYIVAHYSGDPVPNGADRAAKGTDSGVDAIQLELGRMRSAETLKLSRDLGDAIADFYLKYLAEPTPNTPQAPAKPMPPTDK